jgi:hypothetical protein
MASQHRSFTDIIPAAYHIAADNEAPDPLLQDTFSDVGSDTSFSSTDSEEEDFSIDLDNGRLPLIAYISVQ